MTATLHTHAPVQGTVKQVHWDYNAEHALCECGMPITRWIEADGDRLPFWTRWTAIVKATPGPKWGAR